MIRKHPRKLALLALSIFLIAGIVVAWFIVSKDKRRAHPPALPALAEARGAVDLYIDAFAVEPGPRIFLMAPQRETHALLESEQGRAHLTTLAQTPYVAFDESNDRIVSVTRRGQTLPDGEVRIADGILFHYGPQVGSLARLVDAKLPDGSYRYARDGRITDLNFNDNDEIVIDATYTNDTGETEARTFTVPWNQSRQYRERFLDNLWVTEPPASEYDRFDPFGLEQKRNQEQDG